MPDPIKVDGLAAFVRNLRKIDADLPKTLRVAFNAAAQIVVDYARPRVPSRSGRARSTIRARSTRTAVRVSGGGNKAPYYPWLDFGGRVGRRKAVKRPFIGDGRYIYGGLHDKRDEIHQAVVDALLDAARAAGVEVD